MGDQRDGGIAWTDQTWNPIRGCSRVSEGCRNCYAETVAARFNGPGQAYEGLARRAANGEARWTGKIRIVDEHLEDPLRWRRPRRVFVNSMSDLFHEDVPDEVIDKVFNVMFLATTHTFQVLTKRPERMLAYIMARELANYPIGNVWLGVSVEDQAATDARIPLLLKTPAAVRFLSVEPLLAPVDLSRFLPGWGEGAMLHWVIVGGESGAGAREMNLTWARSIVAQCKASGVACFMKQMGARPQVTFLRNGEEATVRVRFADRAGSDPDEWPPDLRVREFPA